MLNRSIVGMVEKHKVQIVFQCSRRCKGGPSISAPKHASTLITIVKSLFTFIHQTMLVVKEQ